MGSHVMVQRCPGRSPALGMPQLTDSDSGSSGDCYLVVPVGRPGRLSRGESAIAATNGVQKLESSGIDVIDPAIGVGR